MSTLYLVFLNVTLKLAGIQILYKYNEALVKALYLDHDVKTMIVEGKTDKHKIEQLLDEEVDIICTQGTTNIEWLDEMTLQLENQDVYIWVDADDAGIKLRQQLKSEFPNATHIYTRKMYQEVAQTPIEYLVRQLHRYHFQVKTIYLPYLRNEYGDGV